MAAVRNDVDEFRISFEMPSREGDPSPVMSILDWAIVFLSVQVCAIIFYAIAGFH